MSERQRNRRLFRIRRVERDVDDELRFHFDRTVEALVRAGRPRDEAEREARRRFGTEWVYRRELIRIDRGAAVRQWLADRARGGRDSAAQALGAIRRSPGSSAAIIIALALGIGVNGTMFRIVDRLWLSPSAHIETPYEVARWLAVVALLVLLIACVNVANLLRARVVQQVHEIGIRLALGAPRGRLVGQLLLEGFAVGAAGGALALAIAHFTAPALGTMLLPDIDWSASGTDARAVAVTAAIAATAGLLAGLPPAIQMSRRTVIDALRSSAAGGITRSTARVRGALVLLQVTMSVLLLVGTGLFVRSLDRAQFLDVQSIQDVTSRAATRSWELGATLFSAFGLLALLLAALGLYSVLAFDIAQRMRELGVRVALGATRGRLMGDVVARGLRVTAVGIGFGLLLAWLLAPRLADLLFGVSPRDAVSYGAAAIALLLVAVAASAVPAWMTIRADPVRALRGE